MTKKAGLIVLCGAIIVAGAGYFFAVKRKVKRPKLNLLLITLDTTRIDRLGIYGCNRPTSPNIDALAKESVIFDFAIAQAAVTPVSHASILTGLNPYHHGLRVFHGAKANRLEDEQITLAEAWKEFGGRTAAFVSAYAAAAAFGLNQGFERFDENFPNADGKGLVSEDGTVDTGRSQRRADEVTTAAITWLRGREMSENKPLFMWVHYFDPHDSIVLPPVEEFNRLFGNVFIPVSEKEEDKARAAYDCEVHYMDEFIGKLLDEFKKLGLYRDTIVVIVADHGEGLGDHDWWTHGILYQEQIHVPLIIRVPGIEGGKRVKRLVRTIDIMPTVLEAAGISSWHWPDMDGISLFNAIKTGEVKNDLIAYSDSINMLKYICTDLPHLEDNKNDKLYCLVRDNYKIIYHQLRPEESELYDLREDPGELNNIAGRHPGKMRYFLARLRQLDAFSDIMPGATPTGREKREKLKSLGYIQ